MELLCPPIGHDRQERNMKEAMMQSNQSACGGRGPSHCSTDGGEALIVQQLRKAPRTNALVTTALRLARISQPLQT